MKKGLVILFSIATIYFLATAGVINAYHSSFNKLGDTSFGISVTLQSLIYIAVGIGIICAGLTIIHLKKDS